MKLTLIEKDPPIGQSPKRLDVNVGYDEALDSILVKLNDYRAPDNQIVALYNQYNQKIPLTYHVRGNITFYYEIGILSDSEEA